MKKTIFSSQRLDMYTTPIYIAFAENHTIVRKGVIELLHSVNDRFRVFIEAANGQELLDNIAKASHQPDVCLIDIHMPEMNGYDAVLKISEKYPFTRCLAFTMYDNSDQAILKMLNNGAFGYITKNVSAQELGNAIEQVYDGNFYFCKDVLKLFPNISKSNIEEYTKQLLTDREAEFLSLCCSDMKYKDIAIAMNISQRTAENTACRLSEKLNLHSRVGLALYALYSGVGTFKHFKASQSFKL